MPVIESWKRNLSTLSCTLLLAVFSVAASAASDQERLAAYRLDMATIKKMEVAVANMAVEIKKDPSLVPDPNKEEDDGEDHDHDADGHDHDHDHDHGDSLADVAAAYDARPPLRDAIKRAGMTSDQFALAMMSWLQASMADAALAHIPADKQAKAVTDMGVPKANLDFVKANRPYLKAFGDRIQALNPDKE